MAVQNPRPPDGQKPLRGHDQVTELRRRLARALAEIDHMRNGITAYRATPIVHYWSGIENCRCDVCLWEQKDQERQR